METCSVVLTFESVDIIPWSRDHSNQTSSPVLLHGTIYKMKVRLFHKF